jgi:NIPSNAP
MIVEERDYRIRTGKLAEFVSLYGDKGLPLQKKHLGTFLGYFTTEIGELNHIVALWGYADFADRERRRAAMMADPDWQAYLASAIHLVEIQNTRILKPTAFSPIR